MWTPPVNESAELVSGPSSWFITVSSLPGPFERGVVLKLCAEEEVGQLAEGTEHDAVHYGEVAQIWSAPVKKERVMLPRFDIFG